MSISLVVWMLLAGMGFVGGERGTAKGAKASLDGGNYPPAPGGGGGGGSSSGGGGGGGW